MEEPGIWIERHTGGVGREELRVLQCFWLGMAGKGLCRWVSGLKERSDVSC